MGLGPLFSQSTCNVQIEGITVFILSRKIGLFKEVIEVKKGDLWKGLSVLIVFGLSLTVIILLSLGGRTRAQQGQPEFDEEFMRMMHPVELARQFVTDDELPQQIAEFKWRLFKEYQKKGFTKDEAFQLVMSGGIPFSASK